MKWMKLLALSGCLLVLCSCGAKYFAEETSVKLYRPDGSPFGEVFSNKGYDGFDCTVDINKDGSQHFHWTANKVNADTVAQTALEANKELSATLSTTVGTLTSVAGAVVGVPVK